MRTIKPKIKEKIINNELTAKIEQLLAKNENILNILADIIEFEQIDAADIIEQIPDTLVEKIKRALAEKNYKIAQNEFPEFENNPLDDDAF